MATLALAWTVDLVGIAPRTLAPYLERRAAGHNPTIEAIGTWLGTTLLSLDRGRFRTSGRNIFWRPPQFPHLAREATLTRKIVPVQSAMEAQKAIENAHPGDVITFSPGIYRFSGEHGYILANHAGQPGREITVRAEHPNTVQLDLGLVEGFLVTAPYWIFENLNIRGTCAAHSDCEHAFHVVSGGSHFVARNNTILDFNAHFKINAVGNSAPDYGLIEGNILSNSGVRRTDNPVTPIDLVAASHWSIRGNRISDFVKADGNQVSYGAFAKGGGEGNRIEQNLVICEEHLRGKAGERIGLSLGGGGTRVESCRNRRCTEEQSGGIIQSNLIMSCSDNGIYINRGAASQVRHNTLMDTGPIVVRFGESSAEVAGNLVDSAIISRDGGNIHRTDNRQTRISSLYLGLHPVRRLFVDAVAADFRWDGAPPRRDVQAEPPPPDLCGGPRPSQPAYGASEDYSQCLAPTR